MIGEDVVKDGCNLAGIYVRKRIRPDYTIYHTIEMSVEDLGMLLPAPLITDLNKARRFWNVRIGQHNYHR